MRPLAITLMIVGVCLGGGAAHAGCYSDYDCGYGNKCIKASGDVNITGICVKPSDQFGNPKPDYSAPQPDGSLNFHEFSNKTSTLLLGSRNEATKHSAINILTILGKCDKKYPGIVGMYNDLSESAHPNFEGACYGYSRADYKNYETSFSNNWSEMWGDRHKPLMMLCISVFEAEYDQVWVSQLERLEEWLVANEEKLNIA